MQGGRFVLMRGCSARCLLDGELAADGLELSLLGHDQGQDAVGIRSLDVVDLNAGDVKAAGEAAVHALALDVVELLVFLILLALDADGQNVVLDVNVDVLLLEAGQLGDELIGVAVRKPRVG